MWKWISQTIWKKSDYLLVLNHDAILTIIFLWYLISSATHCSEWCFIIHKKWYPLEVARNQHWMKCFPQNVILKILYFTHFIYVRKIKNHIIKIYFGQLTTQFTLNFVHKEMTGFTGFPNCYYVCRYWCGHLKIVLCSILVIKLNNPLWSDPRVYSVLYPWSFACLLHKDILSPSSVLPQNWHAGIFWKFVGPKNIAFYSCFDIS